MHPKTWLVVAAASALVAVALGAFGAHGLKGRLSPELLDVFEVGVRYHMYHALGLGLVALIGWLRPEVGVSGPATSLCFGTVVFSGSLYLLALTGTRWLGAITPLGGVAFLVGWIWIAVAVARA